jgi:hypothetical protein
MIAIIEPVKRVAKNAKYQPINHQKGKKKRLNF